VLRLAEAIARRASHLILAGDTGSRHQKPRGCGERLKVVARMESVRQL